YNYMPTRLLSKPKCERIEVEIPRRIANFLRTRLEKNKSDKDMINGIITYSNERVDEKKVKDLLCKYFKEAEDDYYLNHLFDDDVVHVLREMLDYSRESITYRYAELGIDERIMDVLKGIKLTVQKLKFPKIKTIKAFEEEFRDHLLFIGLLNDPAVVAYSDYGVAKLRLRTIKEYLSTHRTSMALDFLKIVREIIKFRDIIKHTSLERNAARLDRLLTILDKLILDDMAIVIGGEWSRMKERLEKMDEIKWIGLEIEERRIAEYIAKKFFKNSKVH
ncbi:MAG: hypothetical protein QXY61_00875, partial [Candidatus Anstonellales archaeon]